MPGVLIPSDEYRVPYSSVDLADYVLPMHSIAADTFDAFVGVQTDTQPINEPVRVQIGAAVDSFRDDWYYRIHIVPNPIDVGNLAQDQQRQVEVFNAWFVDKTLSSVLARDDGGLTLTQPVVTPYDYRLLESQFYDLSITTKGPAVIDAGYKFNFGAESPELIVNGRRVVLWPFKPNGRRSMLDRLNWKTEVLGHYDGSEQRRKLRKYPRRSLEYRMTIAAADRQLLAPLLVGWQSRNYVLPLWMDGSFLTADAGLGSNQLMVDDVGPGWVDDDFAVLFKSPTQHEVVEVESVNGNQVTLKRDLVATWPAGTRVYPARPAWLNPEQNITRVTTAINDAVLRWEIRQERMQPPANALPEYRGAPVLEDMPNGREAVPYEWRRALARLDNGTGIPDVRDKNDWASTRESFLYTWPDRENIRYWQGLLYGFAGRLNGFWSPTWVDDMTLVAVVASGAVSFDIVNIGYARLIASGEGWRDLRIALRDGTLLYRRILAATEISESVERLTLDAAPGLEINPADIRLISFLQWSRLDADLIEMQWHTSAVVESRLPVRRIKDEE